MKKQRNSLNGWINLHKPLHLTSADAVNKVKWLLKPTKIGHAGTLDPLATGVLPLALGEGTKCINLLMDAKKTYEFSVTFGERRTTDDAEGEVVSKSNVQPTESDIKSILHLFVGSIMQVPPVYSALKVAGRRAYDLARAGEEVALAARPVTVYHLELLGLEGREHASTTLSPHPLPQGEGLPVTAHFRATVSKGTYIRSLGRDIAQAVGSEGYISRLHRAAVGPFTDTNAISLDFLADSVHNAPPLGEITSWLMPLRRALDDIPALAMSGEQLSQLRHGQRVTLAQPQPDAPQLAVMHAGELVALARVERNQVIPTRLLNL